MVDLASLVVRLVADTSRYSRDIERANNDLRNFATGADLSFKKVGLAAAGAALAVGAAMLALAKSAIDAADNLNDLSKQTGISTEALSQLQYAAEQSGTDLDGLTTGLRKFVKQSTDAATSAGDARKAFELIGVSVRDAAGNLKPTDQLLLDVAEQFSRYKDGAAKAAFAQELFGKSGAALIPFLNEGRQGIERLMREADRFGKTLKGETAQAADDFNDNLKKLKDQALALGLKIAERLLPPLVDITKALVELIAKNSDITGFLDAIGKAFRAVAYIAVATADTFNDVGQLIGAGAAYIIEGMNGNFDQADAIAAEFHKDAIAREAATNAALARIWGERADSYNKLLGPRRLGSYLSAGQQAANRTRTGLEKPALEFPGAKADPLQEIEIKLKKIEIPEDFYRELEEQSQTSLGRAFDAFKEKKAAAFILKLDAKIDLEEYNKRIAEAENQLLGELTKGPAMAKEEIKKVNEYQLEAARNTQDIIAGTFEDLASGAEISAQSILKSFGQMIVRLAAQAAAANIAKKLFGETTEGGVGGGTGGLIGSLFAAFGGKRDSGGRGRAGTAYMIGTGAQPEMFIPDTSGSFVPAGSGGVSVTNNFMLSGDAPISKRTQQQIAAAAGRGVERASRRNN